MRFRSIAGVASGALVSGLLVTPLLAGTAHAAEDTSAAISCAYNDWTLDYDPTITAAGVDGKVEVEMSDFPGIAGVPVFVTVKSVSAEATTTYGGETVTLAGSETISPATPLANGFGVPTLSADRPAGVDGGQITITGLEFDLMASAFGSDTPAAIPCTLTEPIVVDVTPEPAPPAPVVCTYNDYEIGLDPTVTAHGADGKVHVEMGTFPGITGVPAFVTVKSIEATTTANYGGSDITLTGSRTISPATPLANGFELPTLSADRPAGVNGGELTMTAMNVDLVASAFGSDTPATIACAMTEPMTVAVTPETIVDPEPEPEPVVKVASKVQNAKASYAKKKKVLTVKAAVKGSKGTATGTVKITITKGKKTVRTITVKLNKKGAFTKKIKKIKGKGKFKVVIQYQGDANYKASKATATFRG